MDQEYPSGYHAIKIFIIIFSVLLLCSFFFHSYKIVKNWNQVINRHKFFYLLSFYFIFALFLLVLSGLYQSYDTNGIKVLLIFVMYNFYIFVLQSMWKVTSKGQKEAKHIFDIKKGKDLGFGAQNVEKKEMGFEYFEDSVEIEVSQLGESSKDNTEESFESVRITRNPKRERIEWPKSKTKLKNKPFN